MSLPPPRPGLVISYSFLWADEHRQGLEEGRKARPCAIVAARQMIEGREIVTVLPITHASPSEPSDALELPVGLKAHLGLDGERSWVLVTQINDFIWPGPDLRPISRAQPSVFHYGMLPPRFFAHLRTMLLQAHANRRLRRVARTE